MRERPGRIDWHAVMEDLAFLEVTGDELAQRTGLRVGLLQRIATGAQQPSSGAARRLQDLWCCLTSKAPEFLPRTTAPADALRPEVPGLDTNEPQAETFAQLQAIAMEWGRTGRS